MVVQEENNLQLLENMEENEKFIEVISNGDIKMYDDAKKSAEKEIDEQNKLTSFEANVFENVNKQSEDKVDEYGIVH